MNKNSKKIEESEKEEVSKRKLHELFRTKEAIIKKLSDSTITYQTKGTLLDKKVDMYKKHSINLENELKKTKDQLTNLSEEYKLLEKRIDIKNSRAMSNETLDELEKKSLSYYTYVNEHRDEIVEQIYKERYEKEIQDLEKELSLKLKKYIE